jgi:hypothetical protein
MKIIFYLFFIITFFDVITNFVFRIFAMYLLFLIIAISLIEIYLLIKLKQKVKQCIN